MNVVTHQKSQMKTPSPTTALLIPHAPLHFPLELKLACEAKAEIQKMQKRESTHAIAYGFASLRVRGNRGVIVRYMIAGIVRKHSPKYHPGLPSILSAPLKTTISMIQATTMTTTWAMCTNILIFCRLWTSNSTILGGCYGKQAFGGRCGYSLGTRDRCDERKKETERKK